MTELKVGDRVRITEKGHSYHGDGYSNPRGGEGLLTEVGTACNFDYKYNVQWDNGQENAYREGDIELARKPADIASLTIVIPTSAMKEFADHCERAAAALERIKAALS